MARDMPQRPKQHRREDSSSGTFTHNLPDTWTYEPKVHREYGIDGVIEIFDGDYATGLTFNVQLKGSDSAPASKVPIKTTTRNYWKSFAVPTLVVLVDSAGAIRFEWAHELDTYGMKEGAATHMATLEKVWGPESPAEIERVVRARRAAQNLRSHLPIHWSVDATPELDGKWVSNFQLYLERRLNRFREFTRRQQDAGWAGIRISVRNDAISIRLEGVPGGILHFREAPVDAYDVETIGADVLFSIAMDLAPTGLEALVADLLETAIPDSLMLTAEPRFAGFAAAWFADIGRVDGALALVEKSYLSESGRVSDIPLVVFARDPGRLSGDAITRIADRVAEHASVQDDERAATEYYNAGNMLRPFNPRRALELHDLAAERHPDYKSRSYWWRDRGRISFNTGNLPDAIDAYEHAVDLGDTEAIPLLADGYAANGEYAKAVETWDQMQVDEPRYLWRVRMLALQRLIPELGVDEQQRDLALAATLFDQRTPGIEILQAADALYPDALWVAGKQRADTGETGAFTFYFAAAAFGNRRPMLWMEAIGAVHQVDDVDFRNYLFGLMLHAAVQECGDRFRHYVMSENITAEAREFLLPLLDTVVVPDIDPFVLRFDGQAEQL